MSIIKQINEQITLIERVTKAKKELPNLTINWETDINKMDFSKLDNGNPFEANTKLKIEYVKENPVPFEKLFVCKYSSLAMLEFIEIVKRGEKIIPPLTRIDFEFADGKIEKKSTFLCNEGKRMLLARFLEYNSIPTIVWERISDYTFSPDKYQFDVLDNVLIVTSKSSGEKYNIDLNRFYIHEGSVHSLKLTAV